MSLLSITRGCLIAASILFVGAAGCHAAEGGAGERERGVGDFPQLSAELDWPWWRGPGRNGVAAPGQTLPTKWSETDNVVWRTPIPGRGHSSPIVVGRRVVLTTADTKAQVHSVLCFDRVTGQPLWKKDVSQGGFPKRNHSKNTEATPTVACDGERLFASFFHHETVEVFALDLDGQLVWKTVAGAFNPKRYEYGYAPSPLIYRDSVIISAEYDGPSFLTALDRKTGKVKWTTPRPETISFSSPVVAPLAGRDQMLISGLQKITSFDPGTGKELWSTAGTATATCGTLVWDGDIVFASGGYPQSETAAIQVGAGGPRPAWKNQQKCYEQSMLTHAGHLYALTDNGVLFCFQATDGKEMWRERLKGPVSSSPVLAGGHIYWANEAGTTYVFRPNPTRLELVAENQLGEESFASPAVCGGRIYIRTATGSGPDRREFLYCLGVK